MKTKVTFFRPGKFLVGNGTNTRFWEDACLGDTPLAVQGPSFYSIVQRKEDYVSTVLNSIPLNIHFRRSLVGERWDAWLQLVRRLMDIQLSDQADTIRWNLTSTGVFSVKSMHLDLIDTGPLSRSLHFWKIKVPLRIKIFMWFVHKGVILTKDNLTKRTCVGILDAAFVITMNRLNTSFLSVLLRNYFGDQYRLLLTYTLLPA